MPYRIRKDEGFGAAFARILAEETTRAAREAAAGATRLDWAVHQLRKRCKRVRGLIALYRAPLGPLADQTDRRIRQYARSLAGPRSEQAVAAVARKFRFPAPPAGESQRAELETTDLLQVVDLLESVAVDCVPPTSATSRIDIRLGLARLTRRSRKSWKKAVRSPSTRNLHHWRTRAKDYWYAIRLTQDLATDGVRTRRKQLARIGKDLGTDHDISIILKRLGADGRTADPRTLRRIRKTRKRIRRQVFRLATHVYSRAGNDGSRQLLPET